MKTSPTWLVVAFCLILQRTMVVAQFLNPLCGVTYESPTGTRVVNGKEALIKSAPFMAYLTTNLSVTHCGGSILNSRFILTAAHCIQPYLRVRLGEHNTITDPDCQGSVCSPRSEEYGIMKAITHRLYSPHTLVNDIALLKLNRSIQFNAHIQPICIPIIPAGAPRVDRYQAYGWGRVNRHELPHLLQTTELRAYDANYCIRSLDAYVTGNQFCAGHEDRDTCEGDSGGPMVTKVDFDGVKRVLQLGIVSAGLKSCEGLGIYTYVPNYVNWIRRALLINAI
ncbi:serine protease grass [Drosophila teissieri]|uniref:serine protease grass n=1 Tax=Drosophila teissieri TaxID=7243 RepID=UPI001CBA3A43|nr:serine protease grass [Drosophila teissieri]